MVFRTRLILLALFTIALFPLGSARANKQNEEKLFKVYGNTPVLDHGKPGSWNGIYTDPGAVTYYDGQFHIFYNGFNGWPASVQIGYATSPDAYHWTKQGDDPV